MKVLLTIITPVFTVMFSSTSFAEWTKVGESVSGTIYYVDFKNYENRVGMFIFGI